MRRGIALVAALATATFWAAPAADAAPEASAHCRSAAPGDTDGDGRSDPVVGVPGAGAATGRVVAFAGSATGIRPVRAFAQGVGGVPGVASRGARFGASVAMGDIDGDGCADAVVAAPQDAAEPHAANGTASSGSVTVLYGRAGVGLTTTGAQLITARTLGIEQAQIGSGTDGASTTSQTLRFPVLGDFDGDGHADLALVDEVTDEDADARMPRIAIVPGTAHGLDPAATTTFRAPGTNSGGQLVGDLALAVGNLRGGRFDDLAIGVAGNGDAASPVAHGDGHHASVHVVFGSAAGLGRGRAGRVIDEETPGVPGTDVPDDQLNPPTPTFGDFDGDGHDDLAWGLVPVNRVSVVRGASSGITSTRARTFTYGRGGDVGRPLEDGESFGRRLAAADFNGDGDDELVVSSTFGRVSILPGTHRGGLTTGGDLLLSRATAGIAGAAAGSAWGAELQTGFFGRGLGADLLVSDPEARHRAGDVTELFGSRGGNAGITTAHATTIDESTRGVPGVRTADDRFGGGPHQG